MSDDLMQRLQIVFPKHYRSGNILLINGDCMDAMDALGDNAFDLAIGTVDTANHSVIMHG